MPPLSVLIKPSSSACNMDCSYCFYKDIAKNRKEGFCGFMSRETAEILVKKALSEAEGFCSFMFQGGEPTLAGLDFYRDFIALEKKYAKTCVKVYNSIQTNGYCSDREWAEFFAENHFLVGVSLDGPGEIHDLNRKGSDGKDSFKNIMNTINLFRSFNVDFNILSVITSRTAKQAEKIYNFFRKNNFDYLQFIPCLDPIGKERETENYSLTNDEYGSFLIRIFNLWYKDLMNGKYVSIRHIDNFIGILMGKRPEACDQTGRCSIQFVTEGNGNIYPCDFYVLDDRLMGNIHNNSFSELIHSEKATDFVKESFMLNKDCRKCQYYPLCLGGCRRQRDKGTPDNPGKYHYCEAYKKFFAACLPDMQRAAMFFRRYK